MKAVQSLKKPKEGLYLYSQQTYLLILSAVIRVFIFNGQNLSIDIERRCLAQ